MKSLFTIETEINNIIALFDAQQLHYYTINSIFNSKKKYELLIQLISQIPNLIKKKPTVSTYKLKYYYPLFNFIALNLTKVIQELKSSNELSNSSTLVKPEFKNSLLESCSFNKTNVLLKELKSSPEVYNNSLENTIIFPFQQLSKTQSLIFLPNYNKIIDKNQLDDVLKIYQKIINSELLNYLTILNKGQHLLNLFNNNFYKNINGKKIHSFLILSARYGTLCTFIFWLKKSLSDISKLPVSVYTSIILGSVINSDERLYKYIFNILHLENKIFFKNNSELIISIIKNLGKLDIRSKYKLRRLKILSNYINFSFYFTYMIKYFRTPNILLDIYKHYYKYPHTFDSLNLLANTLLINTSITSHENELKLFMILNQLLSLFITVDEKILFYIILIIKYDIYLHILSSFQASQIPNELMITSILPASMEQKLYNSTNDSCLLIFNILKTMIFQNSFSNFLKTKNEIGYNLENDDLILDFSFWIREFSYLTDIIHLIITTNYQLFITKLNNFCINKIFNFFTYPLKYNLTNFTSEKQIIKKLMLQFISNNISNSIFSCSLFTDYIETKSIDSFYFDHRYLLFTRFLKITSSNQTFKYDIIKANFILHNLRMYIKKFRKHKQILYMVRMYDIHQEIKYFAPNKLIPILNKGSINYQLEHQEFNYQSSTYLLPKEFHKYNHFALQEKINGSLTHTLPRNIFPYNDAIYKYQIKANYIAELDLYLVIDINIPNTTFIERYNFIKNLHIHTQNIPDKYFDNINDFINFTNEEKKHMLSFLNEYKYISIKWYPKIISVFDFTNCITKQKYFYDYIINNILYKNIRSLNNTFENLIYTNSGLILSPLDNFHDIKITSLQQLYINLLFDGKNFIDSTQIIWNDYINNYNKIINDISICKLGSRKLTFSFPKIFRFHTIILNSMIKFKITTIKSNKKIPDNYSYIKNILSILTYDWSNDCN